MMDGCIGDALAGNQIVKHDTELIFKSFKNIHSNLAESLMAKLLKLLNQHTINLVSNYHGELALSCIGWRNSNN